MQLLDLSSRCSHTLHANHQATASLLNSGEIHSKGLRQNLGLLLNSCHLTSESALILISHCKLWDAESLVRSVIEGTYKFAYLCLGSKSEIEQKVREYEDDLHEISRLTRHARAEAFLAVVKNPQAVSWKPLRDLLLKKEEVAELSARYPQKLRTQLKQKWSFHGLAERIANSNVKGMDGFRQMLYSYGMSSHVLHQDWDGVAMIWDRIRRSDERREGIELTHGAREVSDLALMGALRYYMLLQASGASTRMIKRLAKPEFARCKDYILAAERFSQEWKKVEYSTEELRS